MLSTPTTTETNPQGPVTIDPEVVLAARANRAPSGAGPDAARRPLDRQPSHGAEAPIPSVDIAFRPADLHKLPAGGRRSMVTWAVRTGLAVLLALCSAVAAAAWQTYGDQAQEVVARWMPHVSLLTSADKASPEQQSAAPTPQAAAADDQTQSPPAPAQAAENAAPTTATASTTSAPPQDSAQLLQSMAHDLAAMSQQIADLKGSITQLKAGQDQMVRDLTRVSESRASERTAEAKPFDPRAIEQTLRPRPARPPAATSTVAVAAPLHKPRPVYSPPAQPIAAAPMRPAPMPLPSAPPPQITDDPGADSVVRPPMPVR